MDMKNFDVLPVEKQLVVLNAGYTCFGKNGYKKTAMSEIANQAGISKAALFHYFGTKKNLYFYLFGFACNEVLARSKEGNEDFFDCIELSIHIKMSVMEKYPNMFDFFNSIAVEVDTALLTELKTTHGDAINQWTTNLTRNVDWGRFLPHIGQEEAYNMITWTIDGYVKMYHKQKNRQDMMIGLKHYLNVLKKAIYKEEYQ